jgi:beta-fructofuranosidase
MQISKPTRRQFTTALTAGAAFAQLAAQPAEDPILRKAMDAVIAAIPKAESDPDRPVYHFHPPAQWNNDPNGTIYYKGWHHMFYQLNPYDSVWGHMHWGHARSRDMVNWEHLPIALGPSLDKGENHIYSGGAILAADGRPRIFYTSIGAKRDPEQWMAIPVDDDLIRWRKHPANPILDIKIHGARKITDWRDPFLFREGDKTYMVCGGNTTGRKRSGGGAVQLYEAVKPDLSEWKYRGPVFEDHDQEPLNIECPNLFKIGAKWVLLVSPHKPCEYWVGDLDLARGKFTPDTHGVLDPGSSYASNISYDDKGRCILWLWGRTATEPSKGWNSCMALPRILSIDDGGWLRQNPAPEFESLRGPAFKVDPVALTEKPLRIPVSGDCLEIEATFTAKGATAVGLRVRGKTEVSFNAKDGTVLAGKVRKMIGTGQPVTLRVFLDKRVMEVYANDGEAAIFTTVDAGPEDLSIEAFAKGGPGKLEGLKAWTLKPAKFSLDRFRL